jgi:succinate dehydrogenase / fumarate reductase cytochrome b subunit
MQKALTLFDTTIGHKALMAVTGMVLFGFVIGHMLGNLQVFLGPEALNQYAKGLQALGPLLWLARSILLGALVVHIVSTVVLYKRSVAARPVRYHSRKNLTTNYAATTMWLSGPLILLFILYHVAHFTFPGVAMGAYEHSPPGNGPLQGDVFANVVNGFSVPWVSALYIAAQIVLGMHLFHGSMSVLQSLGINHPRYNERQRQISRAIAMIVVVGNIAMPVAVLAGLIKR